MVTLRDEQLGDIEAIRDVNQRAFGQPQESQLVDALRANGGVFLSLVATLENRVVGHILYSPVSIDTDSSNLVGAGLGPVAVLPAYQGQGIGGKLIDAGNRRLSEMGYPFVVVLGHPEYYPRFGFTPASGYGIQSQWDVPDDVFMVFIIDQARMAGVSGVAIYRPEFSNVL